MGKNNNGINDGGQTFRDKDTYSPGDDIMIIYYMMIIYNDDIFPR